jgi:hypothetical protein
MPYIEQAIADATEGYFVDEGEYQLRIVSAEEKDSKKGKPMIECVIEIVDHPDAEPVFHYVNLVSPDDSEKARKFKLRMTRRFLEVFGVAYDDGGFDSDDLNGAEGTCMVYQQERVDENGNALDPPEYSHALRLPKFGGAEEEEEQPARRGGRAAPPARGRRAPEPEPEEEVYDEQPPEEEEVVEEEIVEEEPVEEEEPPPPPVRRPARAAAPPPRPSAAKTAAKAPARGGPPRRR